MWSQSYAPVAGSLQLSALVAVLPVFVVLVLLGVFRKPSWMAAIAGFLFILAYRPNPLKELIAAAAIAAVGTAIYMLRAHRRREWPFA